ncbi:polyribonucleotide nucleotidyltransferase [Liquorilactobacillus aquaticus DSM 21051]|uniref:Polyribonucleotide nucleotidyltransferase n=1 Tax=Liquorilactobacillus aquaticus DSM 21051 TaxID=1423725 RepID=A0A0R2CUV2_9LACO|nr:CvfD/Ygs/GSP13 family RNA-binding post-transcriptional regulator [Liquorilactobacillus aquaticus]KRM95565.1 polyribonucleotide nucleotidyltransferase [Liquorilactobacillus aquaticus DSM 21051]
MEYRIGMVVEGRVTGIQPYGAFVTLKDNTQGLIHISECRHGFVEDIHKYLKVNQKVKVRIIDIDEYTQKISLSLRCLERSLDNNLSKVGIKVRCEHKHYWTSRHVDTGFTPIEERLDAWIAETLSDIDK